jgi:hypothetical protein
LLQCTTTCRSAAKPASQALSVGHDRPTDRERSFLETAGFVGSSGLFGGILQSRAESNVLGSFFPARPARAHDQVERLRIVADLRERLA